MFEYALKTILLLIAGLSHNYGFTPPNPTPKDTPVYKGQHFETMVLIWAFITRAIVMTVSVFHATVIVMIQFPALLPSQVLGAICPNPSLKLDTLLRLNPSFIVGVTVMLLACLLRVWCFFTLGRFFTYRVTVTKDHVLITHGPYGWVRHPSYTGVFLMLASAACTYLYSPGNYLTECGIIETPWKWLVLYWVVISIYSVFSLTNRGKVEDQLMLENFSDDWFKYRKEVMR